MGLLVYIALWLATLYVYMTDAFGEAATAYVGWFLVVLSVIGVPVALLFGGALIVMVAGIGLALAEYLRRLRR